MEQHVRVAAVALDAKPGETTHNLDGIEASAHDAAAAGASLLLSPELSITGFIPNHPVGDHAAWLGRALRGARDMAQPLDGPAVRRLSGIARETGLLIGAGLLEDAGGTLFNTHVLVGPAGVLGAWRKLHVPLFEMPFYNGGGVPPVVETPLGRIGITICIDAFLPESTRLLAVQGAEIVLFPFAADPAPLTPAGWAAWAGPVVEARCRENGVFGVLRRHGNHVETLRKRSPLLLGAVPHREFLHGFEKLFEAARMMHDQESGVVVAGVVKAVDRASRDEREGAGSGGLPLVADTQHDFALEHVEELVAPAMVVRPGTCGPARHSSFPDRTQAPGLGRRGLDHHTRPGRPDCNEPPGAWRHHDRPHDILLATAENRSACG
jgi:N-carbamoylputrescine amidase